MDMQAAGAKTFGQRGVRLAQAQPRSASPLSVARVVRREDETPSDVERLFAAIPLLTFGLVVGLALIFALEQRLAFDVGPGGALGQESAVALGAASRDNAVGSGQIWRLFLAPLLHGSWSHLIGNCVAMALVGFLLEPIIGRGWFGLIFAASALGGMAGSMIGNPSWVTTVGASGAITGLIAAAFVMSFHGRADAEDAAKLRRRAVFRRARSAAALPRRARPYGLSRPPRRRPHRRRHRTRFGLQLGRKVLPSALGGAGREARFGGARRLGAVLRRHTDAFCRAGR